MKIWIIYTDAGAGHRSAALALAESFELIKDPDVEVKVLDALSFSAEYLHGGYAKFYFKIIKSLPSAWGVIYRFSDKLIRVPGMKTIRSIWNRYIARGLGKELKRENPDVVISTHFLVSEVAARLKRKKKIKSRVITIVTDFLVHRLWVNKGTDDYIGMMPETREALLKAGVPEEKIHLLGIPISPRFRGEFDIAAIRRRIGLQADVFTVMVTSGSFGTGRIMEVIDELDKTAKVVQVILLCGTNASLKEQMQTHSTNLRVAIMGFVKNMPELMAASNMIVSRASGLTTCEAMAMKRVMLLYSNIPGQEALNAQVLKDNGAVFSGDDPVKIADLIGRISEETWALDLAQRRFAALAKPNAAEDIRKMVLGE